MSKLTKSEKGLSIFLLVMAIIFSLIMTYYPAKMRLQQIYKIENPSFTQIMLEIFK